MTVNPYNLIILIGAVHGLVLSLVLLVSSKNRRSSNVLLAMLLAFFTLPVLKAVLHDVGFVETYDLSPWSFELLYGLGPSLYVYAKTVTDPKYTLRWIDLAHFLPVALEALYYLSPLYGQHSFQISVPAHSPQHLTWMLQQGGAVTSVLIYLALSNIHLRAYSKWVEDHHSDTHRRTLRWLRTPVVLYTAFFILWLGLRIVDVLRFSDSLPIQPYYLLLIFLSFSTYWIGTKGYLETQTQTPGFAGHREKQAVDEPDDNISNEALGPVYEKLERLMQEDKLYLEPDLSLVQLAEHLEINPRLLSKVINTNAGVNFYDFVNRYRVEDFKRRVVRAGARRTLLDLAHESGFGSKATFNHVFKKSTGFTPSQYKQSQDAKFQDEKA